MHIYTIIFALIQIGFCISKKMYKSMYDIPILITVICPVDVLFFHLSLLDIVIV